MLDRNFTIDIATIAELPKSLATIREQLEGRIIPEHGLSWNYIRYEIWPDTGRIIVFPAHRDKPMGIEKERVAICCRELEGNYCKYDEEDIGEDEFDVHSQSILNKIEKLILESCKGAAYDVVPYSFGDEPMDTTNHFTSNSASALTRDRLIE